ncbi:MAG: 3-oxoacyl-[acyl-carrier-protein] synthase III C-terminal domain-containing protein [Candidatus Parvarchaeota archaeon]
MSNIGIVSYGLYIPPHQIDYEEIGRIFQIPPEVVLTKQGITRKHVSLPKEMPSDMAFLAAKEALMKFTELGFSKEDVGAIIYIGSQWKDYNLWLISSRLQERLGLKQAYSFDVSASCVGMVMGLSLAKGMLLSNKDLNSILLVGASKESFIVNPKDASTSWMDDFADAGVSALVSKNADRNLILESDFLTDGSLSDAALIAYGGAKNPFDVDRPCAKWPYIESLVPKDEFKIKMETESLRNFKNVIERSVAKSNISLADVKMIFLNHMKPAFHTKLLNSLGMNSTNSVYLDEFGHSQSADQFIGLDIVLREGKFDSGYVVFAAAGTGYIWGSTVLKWGRA